MCEAHAETEPTVTSDEFLDQIAKAIRDLGALETADAMATTLIWFAHAAGKDMEFESDRGKLLIDRHLVPEEEMH